MLSLDKAYSAEEVASWAAKFEEWVVPAKAVKPVAWALPGWLALAACFKLQLAAN